MKAKNREELLEKMLSIISKNPGIKPSELNQMLNIPHSWSFRQTLIKRGSIRKEKDGLAVRYYSQF